MRFLLTCFLFCHHLFSVQAQQYAIKYFSVDDGLPSSNIYEVKQDSKGIYWISTDAGVATYDGYNFKTLGGPFARDTWWTYEDNDLNIWGVGHGKLLPYLKDGVFEEKDLEENGPQRITSATKMYQDPSGKYWVATGSVLISFNLDGKPEMMRLGLRFGYRKSFLPIPKPEIFQTKTGEVGLFTKFPLTVSLLEKDSTIRTIYKYQDTIFNNRNRGQETWGLPEDAKNMSDSEHRLNEFETTVVFQNIDTIYTICNKKIRGYFAGRTVDLGLVPEPEIFREDNYRVIRIGNKFLFIRSNANFVTDLHFNHLPEFDLLQKLNINTAYVDHENSLWVSTKGNDLILLTEDMTNVTTVTHPDNASVDVIDMAPTADNRLICGFKNGSYCFLNGETFTGCMKTNATSGRDTDLSLRAFQVMDNTLYSAIGYHELQVFDLEEPAFDGKPKQTFYDLLITKTISPCSKGRLSIHDTPGISLVSKTADNANHVNRLRLCLGTSSTIDNSDRLIISSYDGLYALKEGDSIMLDRTVLASRFYFSPDSSLWFTDVTRGVFKLESESVTSVRALSDVLARDIHFDADSILWAATNQGLFKLTWNAEQREYSYAGRLTSANGLATNNVTAIYTDSNYLYVGTSKGLNMVDRKKLSRVRKGHRVLLTKTSSRGNELPIDSVYVLEADNNAIEFQYVYISPKSAGQITYEYMLEGIDKDWQTTRETRVHYPFLPAGNYRFRLKAKDINGVPSSQNLDLKIMVKQYWYKTTWFIVLAVIVCIAAISGFLVTRFNRLRERERERTEMNNRIAELRLNALQSQMNPHFVFNVLNSIQDCFVSNNVLEANRYMTDFSKLMRLFLESSEDKVISLSKEIKLLSYYIELERMRLDRKFEFEFLVDDDLDPDEYRIPTMILQPIVENAILHGLRYKEGEGKLTISFQLLKDETLLICIEDNGVGRKRSAEINTARRKDHVSKAANIIEERINIINSSSVDNIELKYIDLADESGALGTRVELKMNLEINR